MSCACPVVGEPLLAIAPQSLEFSSVSTTPATVSFEYRSVNGSSVTETDTCGTGTNRIVALGSFEVSTSGSATQTVTPTAAGSCVLRYRNGSTNTAVSVVVE
jgi:hypothetical protein